MEVEFCTDKGQLVLVRESDLPLTEEELKEFRVSPETLDWIFAEAAKLMKGHTASDRVRACASETLDGKWEVEIVGYSPISDPLMQDIDTKKKH
jgi:hypothetical protein